MKISIFLLLGIISIVQAVVKPKPINFYCDDGWVQDGRFCYTLVHYPTLIEYTDEICEQVGAELVQIKDEVENEVVRKVAEKNNVFIHNGVDKCDSSIQYANFQPDEVSSNCRTLSGLDGNVTTRSCHNAYKYVCRAEACPVSSFHCHDRTGCISSKWVCDGERDCESGTDEQDCESLGHYEQHGSGQIEITNTSNYNDNQNYMWTLTGPIGSQLKISIENFNTEEYRDYVHIYDPKTSEEIATLSGQQNNQDFYTKYHRARIEFRTDSSVRNTGFKIKWTSDVPELRDTETLKATYDWKDLTSPFYPNNVSNLMKTWSIEAGTGEPISIHFKDYFVFSGFHIMEFEGNINEFPFSPQTQSPNIFTSNPFRLPIQTLLGRFKLSYKKGCDFRLNHTEGFMFLEDLTPSTTCTWVVNNPENNGRNFSISGEYNILDSYSIKIFDGESMSTAYHPAGGFRGEWGQIDNLLLGNQFYLTLTTSSVPQTNIYIDLVYSIGCEEIPTHPNMTISTSETTYRTVVTITCDEGYVFAQAEYKDQSELKFKCLKGGIWNNDVYPTCQEIHCGIPPPIDNGYIRSYTGGVKLGDEVEYACYGGFTMNASSSSSPCLQSGLYEGDIKCEVKCEGDVQFGTLLTKTCDEGEDLIGPRQRICLKTGKFSHEEATCIKKKCGIPMFAHTEADSNAPVEYEDEVTFTCKDGGDQFTLTCGANQTFEGNVKICPEPSDCPTQIDCDSEKTLSKTKCSCTCKPGFKGENCTEDVDDCYSLPCQHGGTCFDLENDFTCSCVLGWEGKTCREQVNRCEDVECNNGTCVNLGDSYFCRCEPGVTGDRCDVLPGQCQRISPCMHGTCEDTGGTAICKCDEGFEGNSCELISGDPCKKFQCDRGTCNKGVCECPAGYSGRFCESLIDPCLVLNCSSPTICLNTDYPAIQPTCVCPVHQVRSDSGCKDLSSYEFDLYLNPVFHNVFDTPGPGPGPLETEYFSFETEYFYINVTQGFTIILWEAIIDAGFLRNIFLLDDQDWISPCFLDTNRFGGKGFVKDLNDQGLPVDLNNKKWNHVAVTVTPAGRFEVTVNGILLDGVEAGELGVESMYVSIRTAFAGYLSRLRVWNRVLTADEIHATYLQPDNIVKTDLIVDWKDMPSNRHQTRIYPSRLRNTRSPIYLCERGVFHEKCTKKINKTPPEPPTPCEENGVLRGVLPIDERYYDVAQDLGEYLNDNTSMLIINGAYETTFPFGAYDIAIAYIDDDNDSTVCYWRLYVQSKARLCDTSPITSTMSQGDCQGTGMTKLCADEDHRPSIPTANVYTCGELGSYNGLDWRTPTPIPPCGVWKIERVYVSIIYYILGVSVKLQHKQSMATKCKQKLIELSSDWSGLCENSECSNIKVTHIDNYWNHRVLIIKMVAKKLPEKLDGRGLSLSPVVFFKYSILDSDDFYFPNVAEGELQRERVQIYEEDLSCKEGYMLVKDACVACGPGSYYNNSECFTCGYGFYQPDAETDDCLTCGPNKTTLATASTMESQCVDLCQPGYYYDSSSTSCQACPRHFYQPEGGKDLCLPCPLTKITYGNGSVNADECIDCSQGYEPLEEGTCVACEQNFYREDLNHECIECPDDKIALGRGAVSVDDCVYPKCETGSYIDIRNRHCKPCPINEYQDEEWKTGCKQCPSLSKTLDEGSTDLSDCKRFCLSGFELNQDCEPCERGFYKNNTDDEFAMCVACPTSYTTDEKESTGIRDCTTKICEKGQVIISDQCVDCDIDTYQPVDLPKSSTQCVLCPGGTGTLSRGRKDIDECFEICPPGTQYNQGCEDCPIGTYNDGQDARPQQSDCKSCDTGYTTAVVGSTSSSDCIKECPTGSKINDNNDDCEECPIGTYQSLPNQKDCIPCGSTKTTTSTGSTSESDCKKFCPAGSEVSGENCEPCSRGLYKTNEVDIFSTCTPCPDPFTTDATGSTDVDDCSVIKCSKGEKVGREDCLLCILDTYQPEDLPTTSTTCLQCPVGTGTLDTGSTDINDCIPFCPGGKEHNSNNGQCESCPKGKYKIDSPSTRFDECKQCESGYTTEKEASTSADDCIRDCPPGQKIVETTQCEECPFGTYQPFSRQDDCISCDPEESTSSTGSISKDSCQKFCPAGSEVSGENCEPCSRGLYKTNEVDVFSTCVACPDPFTTDATGSTDVDDCSIIKCSKGEKVGIEDCVRCILDTYQPEDLPTTSTTCLECPDGTGTLDTGSTDVSDCIPFCPGGKEYNSTNGQCESCPKGKYRIDNPSFDECKQCESGYTTENEASTSADDCIRDCPPGEKIVNKTECEECPFGTYQPLPRQDDCISCDPKENTSSTGSISKDSCQIWCPAGEESKNQECLLCPADFFKPTAGNIPCEPCTGDVTSSSSRQACDSPFCDYGSEPSGEICSPCGIGFYKSERGNTACEECPANYTTSGMGANSSSDCDQLFCEPGFFAKEQTCQPCIVGTYNDVKGQTECKNCSSDRTTPSTGSTSESQCSLAYCDVGEYRVTGLVCANCTYGQYQGMPGSTECDDCPDDMNTTYIGSTSIDQCLVICTSGQYRNNTGNVCVDCAKGFYQPNVFMESCIKCEDGYTTEKNGSKSNQDCKIICPIGEYRKVTDRDVCTPCNKNSYQDQTGQTVCKPCQEGEITADIMSKKSTDCLPNCKPGEYLDKVARLCKKCPLGEYSTTGGLNTKCTKCTTGKTTTKTGSTSSSDCSMDVCTKGHKQVLDACVPCPIGTYQDEANSDHCKECKSTETTLITGGVNKYLCIDKCGAGQEYYVEYDDCRKCPIGHYKDGNMVNCVKCPEGKTTPIEGSTSCVISQETERTNSLRTMFTVTTTFLVSCNGNIDQIRGHIQAIMRQAIQARAMLYPGICSKVDCANVDTTVKLCSELDPTRKKRGIDVSSQAQAITLVRDVPLVVSSPTETRTTRKVLDETLYDRILYEERMRENGVQFNRLVVNKAQDCKEGQEQPTYDGICVDCPAGTYYNKVNFECVECERGFYQPSTKQMSCIKCQENTDTVSTGSKSQSNCLSQCDGYCSNGGTCRNNGNNLVCDCPDDYSGDKCETVSPLKDPLTLGLICGFLALLFLILVIVACCCIRQKRRKKSQSTSDESSVRSVYKNDYFTPYGTHLKPLARMALPNPTTQMDRPFVPRGRYGGYR